MYLKKILNKVPNLKIIITTNIMKYMGFSKILVGIGKLIGKIPKGNVMPWPRKKVVKFNLIF